MSAAALLASDQAGACPLQITGQTVPHGIVSQALLSAPGLRATLFNFAAGQELSEHTSTARVLVQVMSGRCEFSIEGQPRVLTPGELLHLPPSTPHAVRALEDMTLLVIQGMPPKE
ncbi:MAG: cupin domain-containing protein [Opitutae bacterium]|nr:cupin domain-containing protein [Opitutae bacterium]